MPYSIVILSKTLSNLVACIRAVREHGETARIIVVDDGLGEIPVDMQDGETCWIIHGAAPCIRIPGISPFVFARNANEGIRAAGMDDVVLLNDDALLESHLGFSHLDAHCVPLCIGIIAATTNVTGYPQQWKRLAAQVRAVEIAAFVCVYIPRRTIDLVGLLDERFVTYGGDDVDYCLRVWEAGLLVCVSDFCFVDHSRLHSTFRGDARSGGDITESNRLGFAKWGAKWPHGRHTVSETSHGRARLGQVGQR